MPLVPYEDTDRVTRHCVPTPHVSCFMPKPFNVVLSVSLKRCVWSPAGRLIREQFPSLIQKSSKRVTLRYSHPWRLIINHICSPSSEFVRCSFFLSCVVIVLHLFASELWYLYLKTCQLLTTKLIFPKLFWETLQGLNVTTSCLCVPSRDETFR